MLDHYTLLLRDDAIGELFIDIKKDIWKFVVFAGKEESVPLIIRHGCEGGLYTSDSVKHWILERSSAPNYECTDLAIDRVEIPEYGLYSFFCYNNGRFITDDYWVKKH